MFQKNPLVENQEINLPLVKKKGIQLFLKREDRIHPFVSGNKFRKLKYNISTAKKEKKNALLTFGGAYSNHIAATAAAGKIAGLQTIGIVRGEELGVNLNATLAQNATLKHAFESGMQLKFVSREIYRNKRDASFINILKQEFGDFYLVPEGGTNDLAIKGCEEILTPNDSEFNYICTAVGTGGTISGLIKTANKKQKVLGFPALKGDFLQKEIENNIGINYTNWQLENAYHFGGYAKINEELISFINSFKKETGVLLDPIYTGKMLFGILDKIANDEFESGSKILAIHTGGIQGIAGINSKLKQKNKPLIII